MAWNEKGSRKKNFKNERLYKNNILCKRESEEKTERVTESIYRLSLIG